MFTHYRTQGLILEKTDQGETDRIFTVFTKDFGKLDLLAKAERKTASKLKGALENFYLSEVEFIQGKAYKTLTDAILIDDFKNLRKDLKKLQITHKISELFDNLIKGEEPDSQIWQLLTETFNTLNTCNLKPKIYSLIYYYFLWNFLSILGYQPEFYQCSVCQGKITPESIFFSPQEGGLICARCTISVKSAKQIDENTVKIIRLMLKKDLPTLKKLKIEDETLKQLSLISNFYLSETLEQTG
jgi:DNA repair protein RecO (recombination protein O)